MVITFRHFGRLGNRLFLFSHLIAFTERYGIRVLSPAFSEFRHDFPFFDGNPLCEYGSLPDAMRTHNFSAFGLRLAGFVGAIPTVRFWDERDIFFDGDDASDPRVKTMIESPHVVFEGWKFRSKETIHGIMPKIRTAFAPREDINRLVEERIADAHSRGEIIVGVHLRWEDYRGTEQFFPLSVFLRRMNDVAEILKPARVSFVISSPEKLRIEDFPSNCIIPPNSGAVVDMYTLAACDYILGPPSTFSGWASFYGEKPVFTMRHDVPFTELAAAETWR